MAIQAFNLLANGMGGVDWAGLDVVVEMLGVRDVEGLVHRIGVLKLHRPPAPGDLPEND